MGDVTIDTSDLERADALLVTRSQLGDRAALESLVRRWATPLQRHLARLHPEGADDLFQEVWLRAFRGLGRLKNPYAFRPWLFGIARHLVLDALRKRYASPVGANDTSEVLDEPDSDEIAFEVLGKGLASLPFVERETLTLFYLEQLSLVEVAGVQEVPVGTVKSRLHRARRLLKAVTHPTREDLV